MLKWLDDLPLWKKMMGPALVAVFCLLFVGAGAHWALSHYRAALGESGGAGLSRVRLVADAEIAAAALQAHLSGAAEGDVKAPTSLAQVSEALRQAATSPALAPDGRDLYRAALDHLTAFLNAVENGRPADASVFATLARSLAEAGRLEARRQEAALASLDRATALGLWTIGLGAALSLGLGLGMTRLVQAKLGRTVTVVRDMAAGDLRRRVGATSADAVGAMCGHFDDFAGKLQKAVVRVSEGSAHLSAAAASLQDSAQGLSAGVDGAASQVNEIASASEEMSSTTAEIARNCAEAAKSSERANEAATAGETVIRETLSAMDRINEIVTGAAEVIQKLQERSGKIGQVVDLINDIADQTSLLALNAAIEAARAGEHGRGFAVVADEVKKLAEKTSRATHEIGETIVQVQRETGEAVRAMESGVQEVERGSSTARESNESLRHILEQIGTVTAEIAQIAVASEQQTSTTNHIAGNIQHVSSVMQQTAAKIQQDASDAAELANLAVQLRKLVSEFRVFSLDDAEVMVEDAVAYLKEHGKEAGLRELQDPRGRFAKGELFVYAQDLTGTVLAHSGNPALVGQNHFDLPDAKGKYFVRELTQTAKKAGSGWVDYHFMNPATQRVQPKTTFCKRVDDYMVACGIYS